MAFFGNRRKDFSIRPPKQSTANGILSVTDSANIDFTYFNFNLTANLTQTGVTAGTYGSPTLIPILQIDQWGRVTGVTTTTFSASGIALETNGNPNDSQVILNLTDSPTIQVVDEGGGIIKFNYIGTSGNTYTSNNGITENPTYNFQLGGPLVQNTEINLATSYQLDILADTGKKMFRASSGTVQLGDIDDATGLGNINYLQIVGDYTQFLYGTSKYLYADYSTDNSWGFGDIDNRTLGTKLLISDRYQKFEILGGISSGRYNVPAITVEYGTDSIITKIGDSSNALNSTAYTCDDTQELHSFSKRLKLLNYTSSTAYQTWTVNGVPFSVTASVGVLNVDGQGNVFVGPGGTGAVSSVSGTANRIAVSPTTGAVVVDIDANYVGQSTITTLGTIGTGTWQGTAIADSYISSAATWNSKEPGITAGTISQYWRGDKTWQTFPTIPTVGTWGALNYPTWVSGTPFVKMTAVGTFALDTNTYLTDAPSDGTTYGRNNGVWTAVGGSAGNSIQALAGATTDVTASASLPSQSVAATLAASYKKGSASVIFDGAGGVITANTVAYAQVPYNGTITGWTLVSSVSGSCTVTAFKDTYAAFPPTTTTDDIFVTPPAISATNKAQNLAAPINSPFGTVTAGDWIGFRITGVTTVTWVNLTLSITKTV